MLTDAIMIGMSPEQFWYDKPSLYQNYLDAYLKQRKETLKDMDRVAWLQGIYIHRVLCFHNPLIKDEDLKKYFDEPITETEESESNRKNEKLTDEEKLKFEQDLALAEFNKFGKFVELYNQRYFGKEGE